VQRRPDIDFIELFERPLALGQVLSQLLTGLSDTKPAEVLGRGENTRVFAEFCN
jgi:hypothetical protein